MATTADSRLAPMNIHAIIVAAGKGERFDGSSQGSGKPYHLLANKPILAYSVEALSNIREVSKIFLVVRSGTEDHCREVVRSVGTDKVSRILAGGRERSDSVWNALRVLEDDAEWILVHDGARPFLPLAQLQALFKGARASGAAVMGIRPKPTIKEVNVTGRVVQTLDRRSLREIQTPQVFRAGILKKAYAQPEAVRRSATDDASLVEKAGFAVCVVEGDERNIKITTPFDLEIAEVISRSGYGSPINR